MEKYFKIFFKKNSLWASNQYAKYKKEEIYNLILKAYKRNDANLESEVLEDNIVRQCYKIKRNKHMMYLELIMHSDDIYIKKLEKIRKKYKKNSLKKLFALFGVLFVLYSLLPKEKVNDSNNDLFDELFTTYLEEDFEHNEEMINQFKNEKWVLKSNGIYESSRETINSLKIGDSIDQIVLSLSQNDIEHILDIELFYDYNNNNFNKSALLKKIKENSISRKNIIFDEFEVLNDVEYEIVLSQLYDYVELLKIKYPDIDLTHFICNLSALSFYKSNHFENTSNVYASFYPWYVVYNSKIEEFIDLNTYIKVNFHEFFHIDQAYCICEYNNNVLITGNSLHLYNRFIYGDEVVDLQPYYHTFMLEACAEKATSNLLEEEPSTYLAENEVLNTIEYALMINPNYKLNTMHNTNIYRDPLKFYSSFPYVYDEKSELIDYVEMLESYDYCFKNDIDEYLKKISISNEYEIEDDQDISISNSFLYYSRMKHIELFYKNLFYYNEYSKNDLLEYDIFIIRLFEEMMRNQERFISNYKNPYLDILLEDGKNMFIKYLSDKYNIDYELINELYLNYDIYSFDNYPSDLEEEKINFIKDRLNTLGISIYENVPELIKE